MFPNVPESFYFSLRASQFVAGYHHAYGLSCSVYYISTSCFLANTPLELEAYVDKVYKCSPECCRRRIEKLFTDEMMAKNYLQIFESVMADDPAFRW